MIYLYGLSIRVITKIVVSSPSLLFARFRLVLFCWLHSLLSFLCFHIDLLCCWFSYICFTFYFLFKFICDLFYSLGSSSNNFLLIRFFKCCFTLLWFLFFHRFRFALLFFGWCYRPFALYWWVSLMCLLLLLSILWLSSLWLGSNFTFNNDCFCGGLSFSRWFWFRWFSRWSLSFLIFCLLGHLLLLNLKISFSATNICLILLFNLDWYFFNTLLWILNNWCLFWCSSFLEQLLLYLFTSLS